MVVLVGDEVILPIGKVGEIEKPGLVELEACSKATYFIYFHDDIWDAVTLHNFIEMLRSFFKPSKVNVMLDEKNLTLKNNALLELLKD